MKFSTQLITLIAASSIQAQQKEANGSATITSATKGDVATTIKGATSNSQLVPTNCFVAPCPSETSDSDDTATTVKGTKTTKSSFATVTAGKSSDGSATPTDASSSTIASDDSKPSGSATKTASSKTTASSTSTSNGNQLNAPNKFTYVVAGATFALIGNYLI